MTGEIILIVEDEGLIALHLTEMLEKRGYRIYDPVPSGEKVLEQLGKSPLPDLILMDIGLAGSLDGIETARLIKLQFLLPLIFVTAYTSERFLERIREVEPEGVITKPFDDREFLTLIRSVLDSRQAEAPQ